MPRIRSIKPEFWTSGQVLECSTNARLLFIGLWNFCDDAGRHAYRPKQIKAEVFPADDFTADDILGMLKELSANGLIVPYEVDGQQFLQVTGWHHQRIDKPQAPKYPEPLQDDSKNDLGAFPPDRIGKDRKGKDKDLPGKPDLPAEVFTYWQQVHKHPRAKLDDKRRKRILARLKDGYTVDDLKLAIDGCKRSPHHMGENDTRTVYDDLELICRDAPHVDKFIALAEGTSVPQTPAPPSQRYLS